MHQHTQSNQPLNEVLTRRLAEPLPGRLGQRLFEPELSYGRHYSTPPDDARGAAVLVLLYPHEGQWHVPFTARPDTMTDHAGQVSFPGGMIEPGETSQQAALRELHEELGIASEGIELLGQLSPLYLYVTNFAITPWVAALTERPEMHPNPHEVAEVLEVPIEYLLDPANKGRAPWSHQGIQFHAPFIGFQGHKIWGATSMMLGEFLTIVREIGQSDPRVDAASQ